MNFIFGEHLKTTCYPRTVVENHRLNHLWFVWQAFYLKPNVKRDYDLDHFIKLAKIVFNSYVYEASTNSQVLPFTSTPKKLELDWSSKMENVSKTLGRLLIYIYFGEMSYFWVCTQMLAEGFIPRKTTLQMLVKM